ncbi:MAG: hypothetical protein IT159_04250 [Bryobacterales bacterium]|jgi:hypothetical protein|nr:hypothetical protein [Bryobacterales bacterium]
MVSRTLVQMIEDNYERITARVMTRLRQDPDLVHVAGLPPSELADRTREVLKNLGRWLVAGREGETAHRYELLGRHRYEEAIPLHEVVRSLQILRESIVNFAREQGLAQSHVQLYAQEELEHLVGLFFDAAVYHVVHGYEAALHEAGSVAG